MLIDAAQYARIATLGLCVICKTGIATLLTDIETLRDIGGVDRPREVDSGILMTKSSALEPSMLKYPSRELSKLVGCLWCLAGLHFLLAT